MNACFVAKVGFYNIFLCAFMRLVSLYLICLFIFSVSVTNALHLKLCPGNKAVVAEM